MFAAPTLDNMPGKRLGHIGGWKCIAESNQGECMTSTDDCVPVCVAAPDCMKHSLRKSPATLVTDAIRCNRKLDRR